jgi:pyruvate formate-lyase activating enzyme-like uncharacterized protein
VLFYYNFKFLNLNEFTMTETDEKLIAAAAMTGESKIPKTGYNTPAATGTPMEL